MNKTTAYKFSPPLRDTGRLTRSLKETLWSASLNSLDGGRGRHLPEERICSPVKLKRHGDHESYNISKHVYEINFETN